MYSLGNATKRGHLFLIPLQSPTDSAVLGKSLCAWIPFYENKGAGTVFSRGNSMCFSTPTKGQAQIKASSTLGWPRLEFWPFYFSAMQSVSGLVSSLREW